MNRKTALLLILLLQASLTLRAQTLAQRIQAQVVCTGSWNYEKTLTDLSAGTAAQIRMFSMDCSTGKGSSNGESFSMTTWDEISPCADYDARQTAQQEYFTVTDAAGTFRAVRKAGMEGKTPMELQEVTTNELGKITWVHTRISKDEWLYEEMTDIQVWFDAQGRYLRHSLEIKTWVWLSGSQHTRIDAHRML